jgi:hypothetical protein
MPFEEGPYLQTAVFCEQVIEDKTGVLSLIRIIDRLTHTQAGPEPPSQLPPVTYTMKLVIILKSGSAVGRYEVKVVPHLPSEETELPHMVTVHLEGEERGINIIVNMAFTFRLEGVYWFYVYFDEMLLTKMPFTVRYVRVETTPIQPPE